MNIKKLYCYFLLILLALSSSASYALTQNTKVWLAINIEQPSLENSPWRIFIYSQLRTILQNNPVQAGLLEGGIGYTLSPEKIIWVGYRWTGLNPYNNFSQENRLFQQFFFQRKLSPLYRIIVRSRLEEMSRSNMQQIGLRYRQRVGVEINHMLFPTAFPLVYDELFFQLNHPPYMPITFIGENRLFIGFNLYQSQKSWWEIGYMNQYRERSPQQAENQMSHILSVTYNLI